MAYEAQSDESLALALAREEDEAFALSLAREQEFANDEAIAASMAAGGGFGGRASPQPSPWEDLDATLAAVLGAAGGGGGPSGLEELLAFSALGLGNATAPAEAPRRPPVPSRSQIHRLPTRRITSENLSNLREEDADAECSVCFAGYAIGDELRTLPCMHAFHAECIDRWLTSGREAASTCPVCHCNVDL